MGHVNNTVYFRLHGAGADRVVLRFAAKIGATPYAAARAGDRQCEAARSSRQLVYPGEVEVRMFLGEPGRTQRRHALRDLG